MIDSINPQLPYIPPKPKNDNSKKFVVSEVPYDDDIYNYRAFTAYSTETNKSCGIMLCRPSIIIKGDNVVRSMQIGELYATSNQKGAGTALLDYARALSKTEHCVGIHLVASGCYSPEKVPHLFYRKYGMNTGDKKLDKKMDKFIKRGKKAECITTIIFHYSQISSSFSAMESTRKDWVLIMKVHFNLSAKGIKQAKHHSLSYNLSLRCREA